MRIIRPWALVATAVVVSACSTGSTGSTNPVPDAVVAAAWPVVALVEAIVGDAAPVVSLIPPGVEPHDLELKPRDLEKLDAALAIVIIPGGFQPALERAVTARSLDAIEIPLGDEWPSDPHVWLDPAAWASAARAVGPELAAALPNDHGAILERTNRIAEELERVAQEWESALSGCTRTTVVVSHGAFARWKRFGLAIEPLSLSKDVEPSASRLASLEQLVAETETTTVFGEPGVSMRAIEVLADATGATVASLDPLEFDSDESYFDRMETNLNTLTNALGCA